MSGTSPEPYLAHPRAAYSPRLSILAVDTNSMLIELQIIGRHFAYGWFTHEESLELKADVARGVDVTVEMGLAALVLADAQTPNLSFLSF